MTTRISSNVFAAMIVAGSGFSMVLAACSSPFDSCEARRTCPSTAGSGESSAGEGGESGAGEGGKGGVAGSSPSSGGMGGTVAPQPQAGKSGVDAGGAGGVPSEPMGGMGGMVEPEEGIALDAPCSENGALACAGGAQKLSLICRAGRWQPNETCSGDENCDGSSGACALIVPECDGRSPDELYCSEDTLIGCGPDLVSVEKRPCEGRCVEEAGSAACVAPGCGDGKLRAPERCDDGNLVSQDGCSSQCQIEVVALATGDVHTCALGGNGAVKCWGANHAGQLGLGDAANRGDQPGELGAALPAVDLGTGRSAKAISAGLTQTCAILDDDSLKCWGYMSGLGAFESRGDQSGEMGDALPRIDLGPGRSAKRIAVGGGSNHLCALLDNDTIKCWGTNDHGQLGLGDVHHRGDDPGEMGAALPAVNLGPPGVATDIAAGHFSTCAILSGGLVKCWGLNTNNRLGIVDGLTRGDEPGEMGSNLPFLDLGTGRTVRAIQLGLDIACGILDDGSLKCWGHIKYDQMGDAVPRMNLGNGRSAVSVSMSTYQLCVLLDNRGVKCWGGNSQGVIPGYAPLDSAESPPAFDFGTGRTARMVALGYSHGCAVLDDNSVKCWGRNINGELGVGDTADHGLKLAERGDALRAVELVF